MGGECWEGFVRGNERLPQVGRLERSDNKSDMPHINISEISEANREKGWNDE